METHPGDWVGFLFAQKRGKRNGCACWGTDLDLGCRPDLHGGVVSMTLHISDEDGIRILKELAAERPEYVYEPPRGSDGLDFNCLYDHSGEPGCIIGHLINRLHPEFDLSRLDAHSDDEGTGVTELVNRGVLAASPHLLTVLGTVQGKQDSGNTWGDAVTSALSGYDNVSSI